jgi:hypothetical protein
MRITGHKEHDPKDGPFLGGRGTLIPFGSRPSASSKTNSAVQPILPEINPTSESQGKTINGISFTTQELDEIDRQMTLHGSGADGL